MSQFTSNNMTTKVSAGQQTPTNGPGTISSSLGDNAGEAAASGLPSTPTASATPQRHGEQHHHPQLQQQHSSGTPPSTAKFMAPATTTSSTAGMFGK